MAVSTRSTANWPRLGGKLCVRRGTAPKVLADLLDETGASAIHATRGYEPWEPKLEQAVKRLCQERNAEFRLFRGRLLFEPEHRDRERQPLSRVHAVLEGVSRRAAAPRAAAGAETRALR